MKNKKLWFKAKRYGWGWYPSSWEGVLVILAYCVGIFKIVLRAIWIAEAGSNTTSEFLWNYPPPLFVLSLIMIWICYKTGEKPGWRWA
jgi:hypothetical protein